ncbi:MAG: hypothetical protein H6590_01065 [Flavobacteriales bacterium]|nr:hypothetical protein [Flavobacteriales bacterium]
MNLAQWYYSTWAGALRATVAVQTPLPLRERHAVLLIVFSFGQYLNVLALLFLLPRHLFAAVWPSLGLGYLVDGLIPVIPFIAINYLLVFRGGKHKRLVVSTRYTNTTGHAFMWYFVISAVVFLSEIICLKALSN